MLAPCLHLHALCMCSYMYMHSRATLSKLFTGTVCNSSTRKENLERDKDSNVSVDSWSSRPRGEKMAKQLKSSDPNGDSKRLSVAFGDDAKILTAAAPPVESVITVQCAPKEWPLFNAPSLSSLRVTGFKEKGGTMVSTI